MTHGSQNIIVKGNLLTHIELWGILINPGAASGHAKAATENKPAKAPNHDSGIIISGNQITEYGYGHEYWNWGGMHKDGGGSFAIALLGKQLEENPEISDVLIQGNILHPGKDAVSNHKLETLSK